MKSREEAYLQILDAAVKMQWNIAMILEAKAVESEKVRNWTINHVNAADFKNHEDQLKEPILIHDQLVELIEAITKMQSSLSSNLKAILIDESGEDSSENGFGNLFGGGDESLDAGDYDK
ncbi:restriction endonuclease subunit S [Paenibacillus sp. CMAA1364]